MKKLLLAIVLLCVALGCHAQIDTEFWFAAPDLEANHAQEPIRFSIVTYESAATVVFEQPSNPNYSQHTFNIGANDCYVYDVSDIIYMVETQPYNTVLNYGFYIHSDAPVSIYYESDNNNSEIYSLKGRNALGTSFVVSMQYTYSNYYSSTCSRIEVVASQDDTEVVFYPSVAIKGGGLPGVPVTVSLNRGQSYAIEAASPSGSAHLRNTRVTATKPIAVNTSDDSVNLNGHYDLVGDQIVPVDLLGTDYIAIWNNNSEEYLYFYPTEDNTNIYLNGSNLPVATLDVGQEYSCHINTAVVYIHADHPIAVFQLSASSFNEFGGTVLPQISCTGSRKTVYKRQSTSNLVVTLIVKTQYTDGFRLNDNSTYIVASDFTPVPADPDFSYCKKNVTAYVPTNGLMSLENIYPDGYFHLGILTGEDGTWNYGYFSDYQPYAFAEFQMDDSYCSGQDIEFFYATENVTNLVMILPDGNEVQLPYVLTNAQPQHSGRYSLRGEDCNGERILDVIDLAVNGPAETSVYLEDCNSVVWHGHTFNHSVDSTWLVPGAGVDGCDSIYQLHLTVFPPNDTLIVDASICVGQTYDFHGTLYDQDGQVAYFDTLDNHGCLKVEKLELTVGEYQMPPIVYQYECYAHGTTPSWTWDKTGVTYHEDTYDEIILPDPEGGCDIKHRLELRFHEEFYHEETKMACDAYYWPVNGVTFTTSQDRVEAVFHHEFGNTYCDSTYILHLQISNFETNAFALGEDENCDSYFWDPQGHEYTTGDAYDPEDHVFTIPGEYHRTYTNVQGCDSIVTISMPFDFTPHPTEIYPMDPDNLAPHWVITATEFQINAYDFAMWDQNPHCSWDSVTWNFVEPVTWVLEPFGEKSQCCKVYVLNHVDDTVWIEARAFNRCAPEGGVAQRYWLVCSFYGMEEQRVEAKVYPNPTHGTIIIEADNIERVSVVDMMGQVVDDKRYNRDNSVTLNLGHLSPSVYLLEVKTKEGLIKKRIVLNK